MLDAAAAASLARSLERYARRNIPERNKAYGEFMVQAELLRKGHLDVHQQDLRHLPMKYQAIVADLRAHTGRGLRRRPGLIRSAVSRDQGSRRALAAQARLISARPA